MHSGEVYPGVMNMLPDNFDCFVSWCSDQDGTLCNVPNVLDHHIHEIGLPGTSITIQEEHTPDWIIDKHPDSIEGITLITQ